MNKPLKANKELGCDNELDDLVDKISHFNYDLATPRDHLSLARALKTLAADLTERYVELRRREQELHARMENLDVIVELHEAYKTIRPSKRKKMWPFS